MIVPINGGNIMENIVNYLATNKPDYNEIMEQFISENIKDQMEMDQIGRAHV